MTGLCFIDTETAGLDPDRHMIWELALIVDDREYLWQFPIDETTADPFSLDIGRYWERRWPIVRGGDGGPDAKYHSDMAARAIHGDPSARLSGPTGPAMRIVQALTAGRHLVGAVPSFDEERLRKLMRDAGLMHRYHYHLIDVEGLALGYLHGLRQADPEGAVAGDLAAIGLPWKSSELWKAIGVDVDQFDKHTAMGDARMAKAIYEKICG